jgi:hypothetical protein
VDETSHGHSRLRGEEAMSPVNAGKWRRNAQNSRLELHRNLLNDGIRAQTSA